MCMNGVKVLDTTSTGDGVVGSIARSESRGTEVEVLQSSFVRERVEMQLAAHLARAACNEKHHG